MSLSLLLWMNTNPDSQKTVNPPVSSHPPPILPVLYFLCCFLFLVFFFLNAYGCYLLWIFWMFLFCALLQSPAYRAARLKSCCVLSVHCVLEQRWMGVWKKTQGRVMMLKIWSYLCKKWKIQDTSPRLSGSSVIKATRVRSEFHLVSSLHLLFVCDSVMTL